MIYGIGIDLTEVDRLASKISKDSGFRERIFSESEIDFCESKGINKAQHYAARFSAKEAFLKATGQGMLLTFDWNEIEVTVNDIGKPEIELTGRLSSLLLQKNWSKVHLSLSHINLTACAVVIIETPEGTTV